jgi:hypothetical protein
MVALKQPTNLRNSLCHAKLPKTTKHLRKQVTGTKPCSICPYVLQSKEFTSTTTKEKFVKKGTYT